jgi:hypothetical protein
MAIYNKGRYFFPQEYGGIGIKEVDCSRVPDFVSMREAKEMEADKHALREYVRSLPGYSESTAGRAETEIRKGE